MKIQIKRLQHKDLNQAEEIYCVFQDSYQVEARLLQLDEFPPLERTATQIQSAASIFLGYQLDEVLVAVAELETEEDKVNIASFVVLPKMFRKGIGSALIKHILALHTNCFVTVSTGLENKPAIALYTKHGFVIEKRWAIGDRLKMVTLHLNPR